MLLFCSFQYKVNKYNKINQEEDHVLQNFFDGVCKGPRCPFNFSRRSLCLDDYRYSFCWVISANRNIPPPLVHLGRNAPQTLFLAYGHIGEDSMLSSEVGLESSCCHTDVSIFTLLGGGYAYGHNTAI